MKPESTRRGPPVRPTLEPLVVANANPTLAPIKRQASPTMHHSLPSLLFPEYRRRVLTLLLLRPEEALHGREVARHHGHLQDGLVGGVETIFTAQPLRCLAQATQLG